MLDVSIVFEVGKINSKYNLYEGNIMIMFSL